MPVAKRCRDCGRSFGCGRDDPSCWCSELPPLPAAALDPNGDCLCPDCLERAVTNAARKPAREADPGPAD
ncbi:MAG: cysteine-rich CWC family protein [Gammaproteobacteria bacterium]